MKLSWRSLACLLAVPFAHAWADSGYLFRTPAMNKTEIVFSYAGDLWKVSREGGTAERLTFAPGQEIAPIFSPDGSMIAFTGNLDGNTDVYVMPAEGGEPKRLTYHPANDVAVAWTPDGKNILFRSDRHTENDSDRFFTVPVAGGFPTPVPLPMAEDGTYSPDGKKLAYVPVFHWQQAWKRYRGGQTLYIWLCDLSNSHIDAAIPRENSNDFSPMWVGDKVYFLSDRNGPVSVFVYDTKLKQVSQLIENRGLDFKSASAGPGGIVYEQFGGLHIYDFATRKEHPVNIQVMGDFPETRPHFEKLKPTQLGGAAISPSGARAVFETHGEIVTVPAEKGDIRNLSASPAVMDRTPAWSPDGKSIAWFSDGPGEYTLYIRDQSGIGEIKKIDLGAPRSFLYAPTWSPDSKLLAYTDKWLNLWYIDVATGKKTKIDTNNWDGSQDDMNPNWSPDSKWITYTKLLSTGYHVIMIDSIENGKTTQVTDGLSDAQYPVFDKNGKYLYFVASTNLGVAAGGTGGNLSILGARVTNNAYVMVLAKNLPSPLAPESDDEKAGKDDKAASDKDKKDDKADAGKDAGKKDGDKKGDEKKAETAKTTIDFENISQRILALPIPAHNYGALWAGKEGFLYLWESPESPEPIPPSGPVWKFDLSKRKVDKFLDGVREADLSANGEKMLYRQGDDWFIVATDNPPKPGDGKLKLDTLEVWTEPRAEWRQMYHETWRIEREFLYDPNFHGLNLTEAEEKYAPFLNNIDSRDDLNYLLEEMLGELTLGHVFIGGGEMPEPPKIKTGLLGADYTIENNRYRFAKVYFGENWNPDLQAPLTQPGVNVAAGEYLLAVNGQNVTGAENVYSFFGETAGKQVVLRVGPNPDGSGSREVTVVPIENEHNLRHRAWIEANRERVYALSNGRVAYVHLPDTAFGGYTEFNRYYFAQTDKQAAVIDERYNHGGLLADYIVDNLNRKLLALTESREGLGGRSPGGTIFGPKVMIINQFAGSGGDCMPWFFRKLAIGPLVGKRTWGGLVGIGGYPPLLDGGRVTAPRFAIYGLNGQWEVENHGITPDYDVELDPERWRQGHDTQLEKSVQVVLELLEKNPMPVYPKPAYPNYHTRETSGGGMQ